MSPPGQVALLLARMPRRLAEMVRFAVAGGTVAVVYLTVTTLLSEVAGIPFQVALVLGYVTALSLHFTLQRIFVWQHEEAFHHGLSAQLKRYLAVALVQYALAALVTSLVPTEIHVRTVFVFVVWTCVSTAVSFLALRTRVFQPAAPPERPIPDRPSTPPRPAP